MARDEREGEEALRARLREAEEASAGKSRLIRHVSHEIRTPLSSIIGYAALLEVAGERLAPEARAEYLGVVVRNARHLLHVANDLLNISKVEAGTLEVSLAPVHAGEVAAAVVLALQPQAVERGVEVRLEEGDAPPTHADSGRLRQVLFNLLENAIKYSPPGSAIVVRTRAAADGVRVEVEDRGPGIARRDQARLFKEFSRVNPPGMRVVGAGLGLALSRMLAEAMNGRIGVESQPGRGSTFWISLPAAASAPAVARAIATARPARARGECVGVVEDDADFRGYARAVLERAGYRVAEDAGRPGVGARLAGTAPTVVLLDLHLEGRAGSEVLAELRREAALAKTPVVAFSADDLPDPAAVGFAGRIGKPVEPGELVAAVDAAVEDALRQARQEEEDDFLAPLRARFRAGLPERAESIRAAWRAKDPERLGRELHKLRGAAGGYGFDALSDAAAMAQAALGGADETRAVDVLLDALERTARG
jgi:CheY-like chemotaxis protein/anti-sigma regulatory factor (Ser/Thr protein kinase)